MAGFITLGGGGGGGSSGPTAETITTTTRSQQLQQQQQQQQNQNPSSANDPITPWPGNPSVVLYRNEEIYQKGFEIWQQYVQVHHHHHQYPPTVPSSVPWSTGGESSYSTTSSRGMMMRSSSTTVGGGINCQDCGNQAKKDCTHLRCRTCCKSRGFECATHVKSTWVPAAKRRERLQQLTAMQQQQQQDVGISGGGVGEKRLRDQNRSSSNIVVPASSSAAAAGLEMMSHNNLPAEVTSPAVFRCVRVSSVDDADTHIAYQTAVSIAGRVFKGILYDQGPESTRYDSGKSPPAAASALQQHNLLTGIGTATNDPEGSAAGGTRLPHRLQLDPTVGTYSTTPINAFLAGTQFFPPPRS